MPRDFPSPHTGKRLDVVYGFDNRVTRAVSAYRYEAPLAFPGELPRHPDFTIHQPVSHPVYWEHLGMLDLAGYRADWEARKAWYASHEILPWQEGGGPAGTLVWSDENVSASGIDSNAIREFARNVFDLK